MNKLKEHALSWIALCAAALSGIEYYVTPKIQEIARDESNRVLYVYYSELSESYIAIPDKQPHQEARLAHILDKRNYYRDMVTK